jgi:demethylmenaquinone methyltransferase/2-methoxy-6-polyprenyl-1,4-benzoquinol methylase
MSEQIRKMFSDISKDYDKMNDILSFGLHHLWRKKVVALANVKSDFKVLDCASGTGDLAIEFKKNLNTDSEVVATDFCVEMLDYIEPKAKQANVDLKVQVADVMQLPFDNNHFDLATISFGIRNVDNPIVGLSEMARVVKPNGKVIILETGQPKGINKFFYKIYGNYIMPLLGSLIAKNKTAYTYLPKTASNFPYGDKFVALMEETNCFSSIEAFPQTFGVSYIYVGIVK